MTPTQLFSYKYFFKHESNTSQFKVSHTFQKCNLDPVQHLWVFFPKIFNCLSQRSKRPEVFWRKGFLKICVKFTGEHPCRSVISIKLLCNFIEIALRYECFPVIWCIFSEYFFLRILVDDCFWIFFYLKFQLNLHYSQKDLRFPLK